MRTVITIKKNKPAFKELILLAKEMEKKDQDSISVYEEIQKNRNFQLIEPTNSQDPFVNFDHLSDFPTLNELRKRAWLKD